MFGPYQQQTIDSLRSRIEDLEVQIKQLQKLFQDVFEIEMADVEDVQDNSHKV